MSLVEELYAPLVAPARSLMDTDPDIQKIHSPGISGDLLALWLMHFSAQGAAMTRPVDDWIGRAGTRCVELGLESVGQALQAHARAEAGHDAWMVDDLRFLVKYWNAGARIPLSAEALLAEENIAPVNEYIRLHEDTIDGPAPYAQVAIEYEIERMSTVLGPRFVARLDENPELKEGTSFIKDHVSLDVAHTAFNERQLERVLEAVPAQADRLAEAGASALRSYLNVMGACLRRAEQDLARELSERDRVHS